MNRISTYILLFMGLSILIYQESFAQNAPPYQRGIQGKLKGQVIALGNDAQVIAWCDFNKTIILTAMNVLCVYNGADLQTSS